MARAPVCQPLFRLSIFPLAEDTVGKVVVLYYISRTFMGDVHLRLGGKSSPIAPKNKYRYAFTQCILIPVFLLAVRRVSIGRSMLGET